MAEQILRLLAVMAAYGVSRSTLYAHVREGLFPKPIAIGARAVGWPASWVEAIVHARIRRDDDGAIRDLVRKLEESARQGAA